MDTKLLYKRFNMICQKGEVQPDHLLTFTAVTAGVEIQLTVQGTITPATTLQTSTDGGSTWSSYSYDSQNNAFPVITLGNIGDTVKFKGNEIKMGASSVNNHRFTISNGQVSASGDVTSILNGVGGDVAMTSNAQLCGLFYGCSGLVGAAPNLPSSILSYMCYRNMFYGCGITSIKLPAETLQVQCYYQICYNCSSLSEVRTNMVNNITVENGLYKWLNGVAASGSIYCDQSLNLTVGTDYPSGWTRYNLDGTPWVDPNA